MGGEMINYYYEIQDDVTVFGYREKYLAHFDVKPGQISASPRGGWRHFHDEAVKNSSRVWLENANGVTLVKAPANDTSWGQVGEQEIVWLKLICKDIQTL
jgi:hypothetical protein